MIVTPYPICQINIEIYQDKINQTYGTKINMPVTDYSQSMIVAYSGTAKEAGLDALIIKAKKLQKTAKQ